MPRALVCRRCAVRDKRGECMLRTLVAIMALFVLSATPSRADVRIVSSPGGQVGAFLDLFEAVRDSGERVVIDGPCLSACTLVLSIVPRDRICVTRRAAFGFHAAREVGRKGRLKPASEAT